MKPDSATTQSQEAGGESTTRIFETVEGSHAFVAQLLEAIETTATEVGEDLTRTSGVPGRGREALQLIAYKLEQLRFHLSTSRRRLADLHALRLILDGESWAA